MEKSNPIVAGHVRLARGGDYYEWLRHFQSALPETPDPAEYNTQIALAETYADSVMAIIRKRRPPKPKRVLPIHPTVAMIEAAARAAHEANRAYCLAIGDTSQAPWDTAPDWQKTSAQKGVLGIIAGNGPEESHESWLKEKEETGWKYGPVKDPEKREHPCFLPYAQLPPEQQKKDDIFVSVVRSVLYALDPS